MFSSIASDLVSACPSVMWTIVDQLPATFIKTAAKAKTPMPPVSVLIFWRNVSRAYPFPIWPPLGRRQKLCLGLIYNVTRIKDESSDNETLLSSHRSRDAWRDRSFFIGCCCCYKWWIYVGHNLSTFQLYYIPHIVDHLFVPRNLVLLLLLEEVNEEPEYLVGNHPATNIPRTMIVPILIVLCWTIID